MQTSQKIGSVTPPEVVTLVTRIPVFADADDLEVAPLQNVISLNNANYRVTADGSVYVLRVAADIARWLGVRREEEREAAYAAARVGVGPDVLYFDSEGHMVTPYLHGRHWQQEDYHQEANIVRLAHTLRRLHSVTNLSSEGSVFRRVERLLDSARALSQEMPPDLDTHLDTMHRIEERRRNDPGFTPGLSHNDFWSNNFLDDGQHLWLLDWEFAGNGDGLYDLATVCCAGQYTEAKQRALLQAYGFSDPLDLQSLHAMQWMVAFFEGAWGLVLHGLHGSTDFDYLKYAQGRFESLRAPR